MPDTTLANIERWAAGTPVPAYAIDDQTATALVRPESPASAGLFFMERTGIEPVTSGLQSRRSPS
jgi:hypothetical protein